VQKRGKWYAGKTGDAREKQAMGLIKGAHGEELLGKGKRERVIGRWNAKRC